mmetsp:Transcript_91574/g.144734  ORF Transcript_91574/g.144734 Transcript_91574/m.144734 type:complete len:83 (+) Transcript_91574:654-902(+)
MILALGAAASLEFGQSVDIHKHIDGLIALEDREHVDPLLQVTVDPGALLILTGLARWTYLHRVIPAQGAAAKERLSLVYGCW